MTKYAVLIGVHRPSCSAVGIYSRKKHQDRRLVLLRRARRRALALRPSPTGRPISAPRCSLATPARSVRLRPSLRCGSRLGNALSAACSPGCSSPSARAAITTHSAPSPCPSTWPPATATRWLKIVAASSSSSSWCPTRPRVYTGSAYLFQEAFSLDFTPHPVADGGPHRPLSRPRRLPGGGA